MYLVNEKPYVKDLFAVKGTGHSIKKVLVVAITKGKLMCYSLKKYIYQLKMIYSAAHDISFI